MNSVVRSLVLLAVLAIAAVAEETAAPAYTASQCAEGRMEDCETLCPSTYHPDIHKSQCPEHEQGLLYCAYESIPPRLGPTETPESYCEQIGSHDPVTVCECSDHLTSWHEFNCYRLTCEDKVLTRTKAN